jgi:hypothetical protein
MAPFELAGVGFDFSRDVAEHIFGKREAAHLGLLLKDRDARFVARLFDARNEAPVEARDEPLFELGDFTRRAIGAEDDLLVALVERVERVEKFFLRAIAPGEESECRR